MGLGALYAFLFEKKPSGPWACGRCPAANRFKCVVFASVLGQKTPPGYRGFQGVEKAIDLVSQNPPNMSRFFGSRGGERPI